MAKIYKVGIIGYGHMGLMHAEAWSRIEGAEVAAIAEPQKERRESAARKHGCPVFEDGESMLGSVPLDIVVIATQSPLHYTNVLAAARHKVNIICEKPIALTLEEADKMIEAAKKADVLLAVHHEHTFLSAVRIAEEMIRSGTIGKLYFMEGFGKGRPAPYELMEEAVHLFHLMRHFAKSEVSWAFGHIQKNGREAIKEDARPVKELHPKGRDSGLGVGDYIFGYYKFANGVTSSVRLATFEKYSHEYASLVLHGTRGRLRLHFSHHYGSTGRLFFKPTPQDDFSSLKWRRVHVSNKWWEYFLGKGFWRYALVSTKEFAEDFLEALKEGRRPKITGEDGRAALEMALGTYASHFAGKPVSFPLEKRSSPFLQPPQNFQPPI